MAKAKKAAEKIGSKAVKIKKAVVKMDPLLDEIKMDTMEPETDVKETKATPTKVKKGSPAKAAVKIKKTATIKQTSHKGEKAIVREQIADQLETTFAEIKETVGEKQFKKRIKKASKVLAGGVVKKEGKSEKKEKQDS